MFIAGIDEAGRGPVVGPMVMAIAAIEEKDLFELESFGITDSKAFSPIQRKEMVEMVKRTCEYEIAVISPKEIDDALLDPARNLNILESEVAADLIERLIGKLGAYKVKKVILDCPSTNVPAYLADMKRRVKREVDLVAEHKADAKYRIVGAASLLAKVLRDEKIEELKKEIGIDFGSGYPSDAKTSRFVREYYGDFEVFRKTWEPYKKAVAARAQVSLGSFGVDTSLSPAVAAKKKKVEALLAEGFERVETKGTSEIIRVKRPGVTITLYATGKVLCQGKDAKLFQKRFL